MSRAIPVWGVGECGGVTPAAADALRGMAPEGTRSIIVREDGRAYAGVGSDPNSERDIPLEMAPLVPVIGDLEWARVGQYVSISCDGPAYLARVYGLPEEAR